MAGFWFWIFDDDEEETIFVTADKDNVGHEDWVSESEIWSLDCVGKHR